MGITPCFSRKGQKDQVYTHITRNLEETLKTMFDTDYRTSNCFSSSLTLLINKSLKNINIKIYEY